MLDNNLIGARRWAMISFQLVQGCRIKRRQHGAVTCFVVCLFIGSAIGRRFFSF
jgi:hypothetical protein